MLLIPGHGVQKVWVSVLLGVVRETRVFKRRVLVRRVWLRMLLKIFDQNGQVMDEDVIILKDILSFKNITIFVYEDDSFQIMMNNEPVFSSFSCK